MSDRKILKAGSILVLGLGLVTAGAFAQAAGGNAAQKQTRAQVRTLFVDQNGDGICDISRDHDNDGIPNRQDADWTRPQDGTGNKARRGAGMGNAAGMGNGPRHDWSSAEFRNQGAMRGPFGTGVCDGAGPKGKGKGRR